MSAEEITVSVFDSNDIPSHCRKFFCNIFCILSVLRAKGNLMTDNRRTEMKKIMILILIVILTLAMAACGGSSDGGAAEADSKNDMSYNGFGGSFVSDQEADMTCPLMNRQTGDPEKKAAPI